MRRRRTVIVGCVAALAAVGGGVFALGGRHGPGATSVRSGGTACTAVAIVDGEVLEDRYDLLRIEADGGLTRLTSDLRSFEPALAPDGTWLAYTWADEGSWSDAGGYSATGIATMGTDGIRRAVFPRVAGANDRAAAVSPDGRRVAFVRDRGHTSELIVADPDGRHPRTLLETADGYLGGAAWSPDGTDLAVDESGIDTSRIVVVDVESGGVASTVPLEGLVEGDAVWSPDGRAVLLSSRNYESPQPPVIVDLATGTAIEIPNPPNATRTNARYLGSSPDRLLLLRYPQSVELRPQRLETVDRAGTVQGTLTLDMPGLDSGGNTRALFGGLTTSRCYPSPSAVTTSTSAVVDPTTEDRPGPMVDGS